MPSAKSGILLLAGQGPSTSIIYNHLVKAFGSVDVILEAPVSKRQMLRARVRKIGIQRVLSQIAFMTLVRPVLAWRAKPVIVRLVTEFGLDQSDIPDTAITHIVSVNEPECQQAIMRLAPRVVVVNGTRIIRAATLAATSARFINTHAGITPNYRGVHGGYWALYNGDAGNCGVTVHLVDSGIDTGAILGQANISPSSDDNFETYPYRQLAAALPLLEENVGRALNGRLIGRPPEGPSHVWYHPGFFQYLAGWLRGVR